MREGGCSVAPTSPTVTLLLKFCLQNNFEAKSNLKTRGKQLSHPLHGLGTLLPCPCWTHPYHSTLSRLCTLSTALPRVGKALGRPRSVDLPKLPNAATPESSSSCCGDPPPTPTINLFLLLLHNCHFAIIMNHNANIWYAGSLISDPYERLSNSHRGHEPPPRTAALISFHGVQRTDFYFFFIMCAAGHNRNFIPLSSFSFLKMVHLD